MRDWLKIEMKRDSISALKEFAKANPKLEARMRSLLAEKLDLDETQLQSWINHYKKSLDFECVQGWLLCIAKILYSYLHVYGCTISVHVHVDKGAHV